MWLQDQSLNVQTVISKALSPSHSGSVDEFNLEPEMSGDESGEEDEGRDETSLGGQDGKPRPSSPKF